MAEIRSKSAEDRFRKLIDVNTPIILIKDYDFVRVDDFLVRVLAKGQSINKIQNLIKEWNPATGRTPFVLKNGDQSTSMTLLDFLKEEYHVESEPDEDMKRIPLPDKYLVLKQVHDIILDPNQLEVRTMLLLMAQRRLYDPDFNTTIIMVCCSDFQVPDELSKYISSFEFDFPTEQEIEKLIEEHIEINGYDKNKFRAEDKEALMPQLKGLTAFEIDRMLDMAMSVGGTLSAEDSEMIFNHKKAMVKQAGVLQLVEAKEDINSIGGMRALKEYLTRKSKVMNKFAEARKFGVGMPKGVFIVGMPGCGKSLCAKAASSLFKAPLLKLDMGTMMGKYVGESEANLRKAIQIAEAAAPCVLWIDEIEKAFSGVGGEGSDVLTRMFGYFLGWMQDKDSAVYVVGTANNAEKLPPELKRKGRFDEIFCVNLPCQEEREAIFKVHLNKLVKEGKGCIKGVDVEQIAKQLSVDNITKGFNGADIEAVINDAVETAFDRGENILTLDGMRFIANSTISISKSCGTQIRNMEEVFKQNSFKDSNTGIITNNIK